MNEVLEIHAFLKQPGNERLRAEFGELGKVSNRRGAWSILRQWLCIGLAVAFAVYLNSWWSYALAILVISTRQHALGIAMHEATHWRLFENRAVNDFIGDFLCAFPVNMTVARYRYDHLLHHKHNMTEADPYWQDWTRDPHWRWPKTRRAAFWLFFKDLFSLNMSHLGPTLFRWSAWSNHFSTRAVPPRLTLAERFRWYVFLVVLISGLTLAHAWRDFALLWLVPMSTISVLYVRVRSIAEHLHLPGENEFNRTRHVDGNWFERLTVAPMNINMHIAHHLFPSVPQYHLPRLHRLLLKFPDYAHARIYDSYFGFGRRALEELISRTSIADDQSAT